MRRRQLLLAPTTALLPGLVRATPAAPRRLEGRWQDARRGGRPLPWRLMLPADAAPQAWLLYSHGLGGSLQAGEHWTRHWAGHGIATLHLQHAGSDRAVLAAGGWAALRAAMSAEQLIERVTDVRFALDEVLRLAAAGEAPWRELPAERVGMAGHSFGAVTAQALAGQRHPPDYADSPWREPRLRAALAFSPSARSGDPARAFGDIALPFLSITGGEDRTPMVDDVAPAQRLLPFGAMPAGGKYLLVFEGAGHASFGGSDEGRRLDDRPAATERVRPLVQQASTWFWQAHLQGDAAALQALQQLDRRLPLAPGDRFSRR